jgi:hypothetical protein
MNQPNNTKPHLAAAALLAAAAAISFGLGGCSSHRATLARNEAEAGDAFLALGEVPETTRLNDTQIAAGSRTDSTLRAYHFRRGSLNSLGRQKLDRMIAANEADATDAGGDDGEEMVVYLDASAGVSASKEAAKRLRSSREDAIADYLTSRGLAANTFRIEIGHNPDDTFLASSATGSAAAAAQAGGAPGAPAGGTAAPGGTSTK